MLYSADSLDLGNLSNDGAVVVVVCGGNMTTIDLFDEWRQQFNLLWIYFFLNKRLNKLLSLVVSLNYSIPFLVTETFILKFLFSEIENMINSKKIGKTNQSFINWNIQ